MRRHAALPIFRRLGGREDVGSKCAAGDGGIADLSFGYRGKKLEAVLQTRQKMKKCGALLGLPALMEL